MPPLGMELNEIIAKKQLEDLLQQKVQPFGIIVDNNMPFSFDGILDDKSIVEIKCPASAKNLHHKMLHRTIKLNVVQGWAIVLKMQQ